MRNEAKEMQDIGLQKLPRWAKVAFAVRCAKRLYPMLVEAWPDDEEGLVHAAHVAINLAHQAAANPQTARPDPLWKAADASTDVGYRTHASGNASEIAGQAAWAAAKALVGQGSNDAVKAAINSVDAVLETADPIRRDCAAMQAMAKLQDWSDDTPVDPDALGPLWPGGEPEGWPTSPPPKFKLTIDPGDATTEEVQELLAAVSELHEVHTGYALTFRTDGTLIRAGEEVRV